MFALIDCNSFYASCERLFRPELEHAPIAILSGPEGCIVCASPELKALGASVGEPWFLAKRKPGMDKAVALNANFELYGDLSRRVMKSLSRFDLPMEIYSIDEAFIELPDTWTPTQRLEWAHEARSGCKACGIPVSIGMAQTKTLAKLASSLAKPRAGGNGSFDFPKNKAEQLSILQDTPCGDIWGIGPKTTSKLAAAGIDMAGQLLSHDRADLRKLGTVTLFRSTEELDGTVCYPLEPHKSGAQSLSRTRTFEQPMPLHRDLSAALAGFVQAVCFQLRATGAQTTRIEVFIGTHPMDRKNPARQAAHGIEFEHPTADPLVVGPAVSHALRLCFKPGFSYRRAGIMLSHLSPDPEHQKPPPSAGPLSFPLILPGDELVGFTGHPIPMDAHPMNGTLSKRANLLKTLDALNGRFGRDAIQCASSAPTSAKAKHHSTRSCPTTRFSDIPVASAQ